MASANVTNTYVVPDETKVAPYYDDFDEAKGFQRILFRPGYAIQARELTQLQTIMQNQVERFGRHIFTNGSPVIGGDVQIPPSNFITLNLQPTYGSSNVAVSAAAFKDKTIVLYDGGENANVKFRVTTVTEAVANTDPYATAPLEPPALYGTYLTTPLGTPAFRNDGSSVTIKVEGEETFANLATSNNSTFSKIALLRDSVFFYNGYFLKVPAQTLVVGKYNIYPYCKIGLQLDDEIVTEENDTSLLDPAQEASNYQAPGAARYQMQLVLSSRELTSDDDSKFIELARVESGTITKQIKFPVYSEIEEVLARRTYDESGNYTVKPFNISIDNDRFEPANYVRAMLSPGKAYIYGYEYETIAPTEVRIPKARTTKFIDNFYLNLNYGNYVIVDGLNGFFDTSKMAMYDIHCVPSQFVDFTSNTNYQKTRIGTGRVRDIEFYSGDTDVTARKYEFYLFDTQFRAITSNVSSSSSDKLRIFNSSELLSQNASAYVGATVHITSGLGSGYSYNVESYDETIYEFTINPAFIELPNENSNVSIEFDFADSESFVIHKGYTANATSNANTNISTLSKTGGVSTGLVYITEPSLNTLVFKLPENYVAIGVSNTSYTFRKTYPSINFSEGFSDPIASGINEQFVGATASSDIASTVMDNFYVVCIDKKSSSRANGEVIKVSTSITSDIPETAILASGSSSDTFTAAVVAKMEFRNGVLPKYKTLVQSKRNSRGTDVSIDLTGWNTGSSANVHLDSGQTIIHNPTRKVGVPETLYVSDVIAVDKIYDLNGETLPERGDSLSGFKEVTERFELDNGQRETHYDHASIKLKPGYQSCKGPLIVCYHYYTHSKVSEGGGYFSVDSYPSLRGDVYNDGDYLGDGYSVIPTFTRADGSTVELRDCIDFRPNKENASNAVNYILNNIVNPIATTDFRLDYSYYLGRRDLIVLTANRTIDRIEGVPAKFPQDPSAPNRVMVLYSLNVLPYTETFQDVKVKYVDNKRYTMRDIGKIDKRVENLEYYVTLNTLEKKAVDMSITDVNGLERTKYGIFADSFTGHALGNQKLNDYHCAMNLDEGYLQCQANTTGVPLIIDSNTSTGVKITRDKVILKYVEIPFIVQPYASKDAPVAEFLYGVFDGNIITLPEADIWKSTNVEPDIVVTDTNTTEYTDVEVFQSIVNSQDR